MSKLLNRIPIVNISFNFIYSLLGDYKVPLNLTYAWNYGSIAGLFLGIQLISGIFLSMFYIPHIELAFNSIHTIMTNIPGGWLLRSIHANGASFFFIAIYCHMIRGLYYNSYSKLSIWYTGVCIYILLLATAFLGYVLPWGQMSYWAATVITNVLTVFPIIGQWLVEWVWGGYAINNATLTRFYSLHYILPFIITIFAIIHLLLLHNIGSSNELLISTKLLSTIRFYPFHIFKDLYFILFFLFIYLFIVFYMEEFFNHSDNYIPANPLVTPAHIVPEWYFLPFYAILRSIPHKTLGILYALFSIIVLFIIPLVHRKYMYTTITDDDRSVTWFIILNFIFLGYLGSQTTESPLIELGFLLTHVHLFFFFIYYPLISIYSFIKYYNYKNYNKYYIKY
jgi:ubiquinol-cytochrome c reductase cytochrome b subunit